MTPHEMLIAYWNQSEKEDIRVDIANIANANDIQFSCLDDTDVVNFFEYNHCESLNELWGKRHFILSLYIPSRY